MSYILEALKKADADRERERSAVPSLHAHTDALGFERDPRRGAALGAKLAAGATLVLVGGLAWWWLAARSTPPELPTGSAVPALAPAPMPQAAPAAPPAQAIAAAPAVPPPAVPPPFVPNAAVPTAAAVPPPTPAPMVTPTRKPVTPPSVPAPRPAPEARLPTRNELPPDLRSALPPLNVSGAVYAPSPSARLLFVNGLVLHEGDALSDGLSVERIGRASSVLVFRGQRFELKH
jgi:general secretion pathway protein B